VNGVHEGRNATRPKTLFRESYGERPPWQASWPTTKTVAINKPATIANAICSGQDGESRTATTAAQYNIVAAQKIVKPSGSDRALTATGIFPRISGIVGRKDDAASNVSVPVGAGVRDAWGVASGCEPGRMGISLSACALALFVEGFPDSTDRDQGA